MFRFPTPSRLTIQVRSGRLIQIAPVLGVLFCLSAALHSSAPTAFARVFPDGPIIQNFNVVNDAGTTYTFHGHVTDNDPLGVLVTFGGIPSMEGQWVVPNANGDFEITVNLRPGESGTVTAQAVNNEDEMSAEVSCIVLLF